MKKDNMFQGWMEVFRFTFKEIAGKRGFLLSTLVVSMGLILLIAGIFAMISSGQIEEETKPFPIKHIYVLNDSDYSYLEFNEIDETVFSNSSDELETLQEKIHKSKDQALLHIERAEGANINCNLILPAEADVSESEGEEFLAKVVESVQQMKLVNVGIEQSKLLTLLSPVTTMFSVQGEEPESMGVTLTKQLVPALFIMLLYFMALFYGQSSGKIISAEKTSKIIDTLLLSVKPYALILGKIAALTTAGVLQFFTWFFAVLVGIFVGNAVGHLCNSDFTNPLYEIFKLLRETGTGEALSVWSVLLGVIVFVLGFAFYMALAGLMASRISKAEDLAQGVGMYQMIMILSFLASYFPLMSSSTAFTQVTEWIPFTAAFLLPGKIVLGESGIILAISKVFFMALFTLILAVLTAKLYRNQVFYNGKRKR